MATSTEKLVVELDAKTAKLDAKLKDTNKKLDKVGGSAKKAEVSLKDMAKAGVTVITALTTAVTAAAVEASQFAKEIDVAANRAGLSVEAMQSLAFATNTVGISTEKLGDIYKDTNEKVGEFLATGGGGFRDFVDVMRMTDDQAEILAERFAMMSGDEVLQEMVNQMDSAGISGQKMSFALEGMASDTTDLIPLLIDGGDEMKRLRGEFDELDASLNATDIDKLKTVGEEFNKFTTGFSTGSRQMIADYSDEIIKAMTVTTMLATKTVAAFDVISTGWGNIIALAAANLTDLINGTDTFEQVLAERTAMSADALNELLGENFFNAGYELGQQMGEGQAQGYSDAQNQGTHIIAKGGKKLTDWEKLNSKERLGISKQYIGAAMTLNQALLDDNKAINAGLIVADTAAGIMRAYKESNFYVATAQAVVIAATGLAQLSNLSSASKGGGSISTSGGGGASAQTQREPDFEQETTDLELTESSIGGSNVQRIEFATDSGDELIDAIAAALNNGQRKGQV